MKLLRRIAACICFAVAGAAVLYNVFSGLTRETEAATFSDIPLLAGTIAVAVLFSMAGAWCWGIPK